MDVHRIDERTRLSPEIWLDAATDSLLEGGVEAVRILPLADRLGFSRASFYRFYESRDALLAALLDRWRTQNTGGWVARAGAYADSIGEALLNVFDCCLDDSLFDTRYEAAIRSWAQQSPEIAAIAREEDAKRIDALAAMFARFGYAAETAEVRGRSVYFVQLGYVALRSRESVAVRMERIPEYVGLFSGVRATGHEMERFFARHGFESG